MRFKAVSLMGLLMCFSSVMSFSFPDGSSLIKAEEALNNLAPEFSGTPVYLIKNDQLKKRLKDSLADVIGMIEAAAKENPTENRVLLLFGKAYSYGHDLDIPGAWQKSTKYLEDYISVVSESHEALLYLGKNYMDAQRFKNAYIAYEKAHKIAPETEAQKFMAFCLMYQKRIPEAIAAMRSYASSHPGDSDAHKMLQALEEKRFSFENS